MANRLTKNPRVIDTADTSVPGPLRIKRMMWVGTAASGKDIAAADVLTINDNANSATGGVVYEQKPTAGQLGPFEIYNSPEGWFFPNGIYVDTIDGGELFIWV